MKVFFTLLDREVKSYFYTPIAYVVLFFFMVIAGFNFTTQVRALNGLPTDYTLVEAFFIPPIFWFPFVLSFPLITMRVYAEEFRMGTFETLTTAPVSDLQVVLAKFFGVFVFYIILWSPTLASFAAFQYISGSAAANTTGAFIGAYFLLLLVGGLYISIGCLASSLVKDQVNAAAISFTTITLLLFVGFIPDIQNITDPGIKSMFHYISTVQHMQDVSKGLIDTRPLIYYPSMTILVLYLTLQVFQYRKWKA